MRVLHSLIASVALVAACGHLASAPPAVVAGQSVQLQNGQSAAVAGSTVQVQFVRAADSRCPADAVCITAGEAAIEMVLSGSGPTQTVTLRLRPSKTSVTATYGGLLFEATALDPYPTLQPSSTQTLTLRVTALSS